MSTYGSSKVVTDGLVFCIDPANKNSYSGSGTAFNDLTSGKFNGRLNGSTLPSLSSDGFSFIFNNDANVVFTGTTPTNNINTVDIWVQFNSSSNNVVIFSGPDGYNSSLWEWGFFVFGNLIYFTNGSPLVSITTSVTPYLGLWKNFTIVRNDSSFCKIYIDGVYFSQIAVSGVTSTNQLRLASASATYLGGGSKLSNIKIYNRALSQSEITQNFNALRGRFGI